MASGRKHRLFGGTNTVNDIILSWEHQWSIHDPEMLNSGFALKTLLQNRNMKTEAALKICDVLYQGQRSDIEKIRGCVKRKNTSVQLLRTTTSVTYINGRLASRGKVYLFYYLLSIFYLLCCLTEC